MIDLPEHVSTRHATVLHRLATNLAREHGDTLVGIVLSGSAGRGMATERSDVDVYAVLDGVPAAERPTTRSAEVDLVTTTLTELEAPAPYGTGAWFFRWSFAWAPVLLDRTGGRLTEALYRLATLTAEEAHDVLVEHDRLDGWLNYAYRALKNDRDGRELERRLDAAESLPWLLDVVWALAGRVRPYHKYLPWELRQHPLPDWPADVLLPLLTRTLDGDPAAVRETFARVERLTRDHPCLKEVVNGWGGGLALLRRTP